MSTSQNGYKANDPSLIATYTVPASTVRISLRKGDVSVVLLDFASWYHKNIEPLRQADTGGYVERTIRGSSTTLSNHASGTAMDLRWNDHPLGAVGTFTAEEKRQITARLAFYEGVIRWGANYSGRKDEMHFEINKGTGDVARVADKVRASQRKVENVEFKVVVPLVGEGDRDDLRPGFDMIGRIQLLKGLKKDGWWGPATTKAVGGKVMTEDLYRNIFGLSVN